MFGAKTSPTGKTLDGIDMQSYFATSPETGEQLRAEQQRKMLFLYNFS